ncbi:GntR family transcriptional regulator [Pseudonocardia sp. RS11V-5]|uniref:GntR family transcriptional regulator n=1 Tax=Pseudonocardia terrae TaxID=2905831 RepID=UPI001E2A691A|nr:GntR family transcriptional regulator [Pseudonocardia terrae]MCE3551418.1 GntR family transcriptional regulator [Pseudonocardia terrae]
MSRAVQSAEQPSAWKNAQVGRVAAPLRDQVLGIVRQAIMDFELKPGQRLVERELIEHLGVSRSTVREVLGQLSAEGLVTIVPQKGAVVTVPTAEDAADLYEIRASLEALAVRRFVERATEAQRAALRVAFDEYARASEDGAVSALVAKDELYRVLLDGADSAPIQQLLASAQGRVRAMRATSLSEPGRAREAVEELRLVVEAIEAGKAAQAAKLCAAHVRAAARSGLRRLAEIESDLT